MGRTRGCRGRKAAFIAAYLECPVGREAARKAGYRGSDRSLTERASRLLALPEVRLAIDQAYREAAEKAQVSVNETVATLTAHMRGSFEPFISFDKHGRVKFDLTKARQAQRLGLIRKLKVRPIYRDGVEVDQDITLVLQDQQAAAIALGRHLGLFRDKVEHTGSAGGGIQLVLDGPLAPACPPAE